MIPLSLKPIGPEAEAAVQEVLDDVPVYYLNMEGVETYPGAARHELAYWAVERFAAKNLRCTTLRLGVNDSNPVEGFWRKMGFEPTGETKLHQGIARVSTIQVMEKRLTVGG